jgi:hypothetical protein
MLSLVLASDMEELIPVVAIVGGVSVAIFAIIAGTVKAMVQTKHREHSRREIAAYVAEGSISADDGAKLIAAGRTSFNPCSGAFEKS